MTREDDPAQVTLIDAKEFFLSTTLRSQTKSLTSFFDWKRVMANRDDKRDLKEETFWENGMNNPMIRKNKKQR